MIQQDIFVETEEFIPQAVTTQNIGDVTVNVGKNVGDVGDYVGDAKATVLKIITNNNETSVAEIARPCPLHSIKIRRQNESFESHFL